MRTTLTAEQAAVLLAAGIPPSTVANMMLGVQGRRYDKALGAPKPRKAEPPADYSPSWHVYPSERAGNLDAATGHRPGAVALEIIRAATHKHGIRYAPFRKTYYGDAEQMVACTQALAEQGIACIVHETRDEGLAAAAQEPEPEGTAAPAAAIGTGSDAIARLRAALSPKPVAADSVSAPKADRATPRKG